MTFMAAFKQVFILSTKRHGTLVAQFRLVGAPSPPPLIDWMESNEDLLAGLHSQFILSSLNLNFRVSHTIHSHSNLFGIAHRRE